MTDIDFLSLIEEGAQSWNQWRIDNPTVQPNLSKAYLFGQVLAGFNLSGANLERACLIGANLQGANLKNAQLRSVYASSADFKGADLSNATLQGSSFSQANFSDANLSGAQAFGANFSGVVFTGACLSAWHIDKTTVLSGIKASHVCLSANRNPQTGAFQPGALEPFLRLAAVQSTAIPTTLGVAPVGTLTANVRDRVYALVNSEAASKLCDRLKPAALHQTGQHVSELVIQTAAATTICVVEQARAIQNSEVVGHLIIAFHPDSPGHITPGALHQLNPTVTARLKALIHELLEIGPVRYTLQGTSRQTLQIQHKTQAALCRGIEAFGQSKVGATLTVVTQSKAGRYILEVFEPDGVTRVTTGVLSPYLQQFNAERIAQVTAKATQQSVEQLRVLFTPDSVERVTAGKLHQLSPNTLNRLERVLFLEAVHSAGAKIGEVSVIAKSAAIHCSEVLSQSAVFVQVATWLQSKPICRVTRHFKPDGVNCVSQGALHGVLPKVLAQHNLTKTRDRTGQLISKLSSPKKLEAEIKKLCDQHPVSAGLGATAGLVFLLLNLMPQSDSVLGKAAGSLSAAPTSADSTISTAPTVQANTGVQTNAESSDSPLPALEVASIAMPCPIGGASRQAVDQDNGYAYENGAMYYGAISNGQPADGQGMMIYPTGNRYEGDYQNGQRQGCGTFTFANGRQYIGQFEADQFNGRGTWIIENGERYIGEFKNNQCSGNGTFIFANGSTKSGIWADGQLPGSQLSCDRGSLALPSSQDM